MLLVHTRTMWQKFGQHFLHDQSVLDQTIDTIRTQIEQYDCTHLIEIGPGRWALTKKLAQITLPQTLFEIDKNLEGFLVDWTNNHPHQHVERWDFLQQDISRFDQSSTLVVWNLPYYITSPIFRKCFCDNAFQWGAFLIQDEVAQKITTGATKKSFLWRLLNYAYDVSYIMRVPANAFTPPPNVTSAVVAVDRHDKHHSFTLQRLITVLDTISSYKRKTLRKSLLLASYDPALIEKLPSTLLTKRLEACDRDDIALLISVIDSLEE